jgi:hypothetical protein
MYWLIRIYLIVTVGLVLLQTEPGFEWLGWLVSALILPLGFITIPMAYFGSIVLGLTDGTDIWFIKTMYMATAFAQFFAVTWWLNRRYAAVAA